MRKAQFLALIFASGMILSSCAGGGSKTEAVWPSTEEESSNSMTSSDTNNQSSAFSSTEDSQKDSSVLSSLQSTAEGYKKVLWKIQTSSGKNCQVSAEIPDRFTTTESGFNQSDNPYILGRFNLHVNDDQQYPENYFEDPAASTFLLSYKKLGAPPEKEYQFSLTDGTKVYLTGDGAAGTTYAWYQFIKNGECITFLGEFSDPGNYDSGYESLEYTDEEMQHILSSLEFIEE